MPVNKWKGIKATYSYLNAFTNICVLRASFSTDYRTKETQLNYISRGNYMNGAFECGISMKFMQFLTREL